MSQTTGRRRSPKACKSPLHCQYWSVWLAWDVTPLSTPLAWLMRHSLQSYSLKANNIRAAGVAAIGEALKHSPPFTDLKCVQRSTAVGEGTERRRASYPRVPSSATQLDVEPNRHRGCEVARGGPERERLTDQVEVSSRWRDYDALGTCWLTAEPSRHSLRSCRIQEEGAEALAEALKFNSSLLELECALTAGAGDPVGQVTGRFLPAWPSLHANRVGDRGGRALAESLKTNNTLTWLEYAACGIEATDCTAADAPHHNHRGCTA